MKQAVSTVSRKRRKSKGISGTTGKFVSSQSQTVRIIRGFGKFVAVLSCILTLWGNSFPFFLFF